MLKLWVLSSLYLFFNNTWYVIIAPNHFIVGINLLFKIWLSISKQTSHLFGIFISWTAVRLFLHMSQSFLHNAEALFFLILSTSTIFNKQWKCELSYPHKIPSFSIQLRCWLDFRSSDAVDSHGKLFLRDIYFAAIAIDDQLLLNNNYNSDTDYNNMHIHNINKIIYNKK